MATEKSFEVKKVCQLVTKKNIIRMREGQWSRDQSNGTTERPYTKCISNAYCREQRNRIKKNTLHKLSVFTHYSLILQCTYFYDSLCSYLVVFFYKLNVFEIDLLMFWYSCLVMIS